MNVLLTQSGAQVDLKVEPWSLEHLLTSRRPSWFPQGFQVSGPDQIACLSGASKEEVPDKLVALGDEKRGGDVERIGVHTYVADNRIIPFVWNANQYVDRLSRYTSVLSPDLTVGLQMSRWQRSMVTYLSRATGAYFESRGLKVIPSIRALIPEDYDVVASGIPVGSVIAFGAYSLRRNHELRARFEHGVHAMIEMIQPEAVMIYGSTRPIFRAQVEAKTDLCLYAHPLHEARVLKRESLYPPRLF